MMGLLGGSRIDGITIFLSVTLVLYTILCNGVFATFTSENFVDPYGGKHFNLDLGEEFDYSDVENVTGGMIPPNIMFSDLNPNRAVRWSQPFFSSNYLSVVCYGKNWWDNWVATVLNPEKMTESKLLQIYDSNMNFSKVSYNIGGEFETHAFYCPLFYYDEVSGEIIYIDEDLETSFENGKITVVLAINQTFINTYDIGKIFGILTGFSTYGTPMEASVVIGGIFWVLLILLAVKLVVG